MLKFSLRLLSVAVGGLFALTAFTGCASQSAAPAASAKAEAKPVVAPAAAAPAEQKVDYYFVVFHENGRIYPIADVANYLEFMHSNELIYTRTRIGEGPDGATLVFGIEKKEADNLAQPSKAELFYDGKYEPTGPFYGEVFKDGRYYVFGEWKDFKDYMEHGEVTYTWTEIGVGPNGETVIYGLNKDTVKAGRPVALIERFNALRKKAN